jgi:hypothetical protein
MYPFFLLDMFLLLAREQGGRQYIDSASTFMLVYTRPTTSLDVLVMLVTSSSTSPIPGDFRVESMLTELSP